ncbi:MAG: hypothetical protein H7244_05610 [Herminiimonas sp.]|jgi:hypothetical protein|nr:hypothetical protein [Herminiimonas sp.]
MSIDQADQIDAVTIDAARATCQLTIIDHLAWDHAHLQALELKINHYLKFIESGEIFVQHPAAANCDFRIEVAAIYTPPPTVLAFFGQAKLVLESAGVLLSVGPLGSGYADGPA